MREVDSVMYFIEEGRQVRLFVPKRVREISFGRGYVKTFVDM